MYIHIHSYTYTHTYIYTYVRMYTQTFFFIFFSVMVYHTSYVLDTNFFFWLYVLQNIFSQFVACFFINFRYPSKKFYSFNSIRFFSLWFVFFISCLKKSFHTVRLHYILFSFFFPKVLKFTFHFELSDSS